MSWATASRFYHQLALITRTGIALPEAIGMAGNVAGGWHGRHAPAWREACRGGGGLADQLEASGEARETVALIRAGERSGRLPELAQAIATAHDHRIELRSLVIARLLYPAVLLHAGLILPAVPPVVLGYASPWKLLLGPSVLYAVVAIGAIVLRLTTASGLLARLLLAFPLRGLAMPLIEAHTYRVLQAAFLSGMLVPEALELASGACGNRVMEGRLRAAASDVRSGLLPNLGSALAHVGFPRTPVGLVANGEQVGKTDEVLGQVTTLAEESFRTRSLYAAKVVTGTIYGIAMVMAIIAIFQGYGAYIGQIKDLTKEDS